LFDHLVDLPVNQNWAHASSIYKQNMDWMGMMTYWNENSTDDLFIYLEDDFVICPNAALQLLQLYDWVKMNPSVNGVKFSYGGSGMVLRRKNVPKYLNRVRYFCFQFNAAPVDWVLGDYWSTTSPKGIPGAHLHTWRYNLFWHIGLESMVGNIGNKGDEYRVFQAKCYDVMSHTSIYAYEQFNLFECNRYMMSPCRENFEISRTYRPANQLVVDTDLSRYIKYSSVVSTLGQNCDDACLSRNKICNLQGFALLNGNTKGSKRSREVYAPGMENGVRFVQSTSNFSCDAKNPKFQRFCPCFDHTILYTELESVNGAH
jgi:hypothetical protein